MGYLIKLSNFFNVLFKKASICCCVFICIKRRKNLKKTRNKVIDTEIDTIENENLLVYKLQGGNEVNQVKKTKSKSLTSPQNFFIRNKIKM